MAIKVHAPESKGRLKNLLIDFMAQHDFTALQSQTIKQHNNAGYITLYIGFVPKSSRTYRPLSHEVTGLKEELCTHYGINRKLIDKNPLGIAQMGHFNFCVKIPKETDDYDRSGIDRIQKDAEAIIARQGPTP